MATKKNKTTTEDPRFTRVINVVMERFERDGVDQIGETMKLLLGSIDWSDNCGAARYVLELLFRDSPVPPGNPYEKARLRIKDEKRRNAIAAAADRGHALSCTCCAKRLEKRRAA